MSKHIPYVYLIGWSTLNKWYYGVRYAINCHPTDLWKTYFTSSKYVDDFYKEHGAPDVVEIRKTFQTVTEATSWEEKVLRRMKVVENDIWLNKNDRHAPPILKGDSHPMKRPEVARKYGDTMLKVWEEMSDTVRESHREKVGIASRQYWNEMSAEEYQRISTKRSLRQSIKEANKTADEKKLISDKQSDSAKLLWSNRTIEEREQHRSSITLNANIRVSCIKCKNVTTPSALTRFHKECKIK